MSTLDSVLVPSPGVPRPAPRNGFSCSQVTEGAGGQTLAEPALQGPTGLASKAAHSPTAAPHPASALRGPGLSPAPKDGGRLSRPPAQCR